MLISCTNCFSGNLLCFESHALPTNKLQRPPVPRKPSFAMTTTHLLPDKSVHSNLIFGVKLKHQRPILEPPATKNDAPTMIQPPPLLTTTTLVLQKPTFAPASQAAKTPSVCQLKPKSPLCIRQSAIVTLPSPRKPKGFEPNPQSPFAIRKTPPTRPSTPPRRPRSPKVPPRPTLKSQSQYNLSTKSSLKGDSAGTTKTHHVWESNSWDGFCSDDVICEDQRRDSLTRVVKKRIPSVKYKPSTGQIDFVVHGNSAEHSNLAEYSR